LCGDGSLGQRLTEVKERIATIAIFTGVFLPIRLLFYSYVSQIWIGSFGIMTAVLLVLMYFSNKDKLGYVGYIINKHTYSFAKGKFGKFAMVWLVFTIYISGNMIYGIEHPPQEFKAKVVNTLSESGIKDMESVTEKSKDLHFEGPGAAMGPLFSVIIILIPNKMGHSVYSILNDFSDGWILHFATVILIEELEVLGLLIYFRYFYKPRSTSLNTNVT